MLGRLTARAGAGVPAGRAAYPLPCCISKPWIEWTSAAAPSSLGARCACAAHSTSSSSLMSTTSQAQHGPPTTGPNTPAQPTTPLVRSDADGTQSDHASHPSPSSSTPSRVPSLRPAAPSAPPLRSDQLDELVEIIRSSKRLLVMTGAGVSTESNIPDYRGPNGAYTTGFKPMTHQQFMDSAASRARYWARSFVGWHEFSSVEPNDGHVALARLQQAGWVGPIITQNVDRLHHKAGADRVLELHGTTHRVVCMSCGEETCRHQMQQTLADLNPAMANLAERIAAAVSDPGARRAAWQRALRAGTAADADKVSREGAVEVPVTRPDGDVELQDAGQGFIVPPCSSCGGVLKPGVVFFGDSVPKDKVDRCYELAAEHDTMLVVGSSLMVWSAYRLAKAACSNGARLVIVNIGETRADELAHYKVEAVAGEVLMKLASHPTLLLPRV